MNSKERLKQTLNHQQPDSLVVDFGSNAVTGIHVSIVEKLRDYLGLKKQPVKVIEPYQMLGEVDNDLIDALGIDVIGFSARSNFFGQKSSQWKKFTTFWGQTVLVPTDFETETNANGDLLIYPEGDRTARPSAMMPKSGYFFDTIIRQEPIVEEKLNYKDNLEEFPLASNDDLDYWKRKAQQMQASSKGVMANFGGTGLGDIAIVPAPFLKNPKGIRDVTEWYMSTVLRPNYVKSIFEEATDIAIENLKKYFEIVGNSVDAVFICGTDFGTQNSTFCSTETYDDLWLPYYKKMNNWIHENTQWKTFKHSCGAVESFMPKFIESGFDIINPVQITATGMEPEGLKQKYGKDIVFWGGGVDTQHVLPFGKPEEVRKQVLRQCEIMNRDGGFVFNAIHNIQAGTPIENLAALFEAINEYNGSSK